MFYTTTTQPRGFSKSFPLNVLQHYYSAKRFFQEFSSQCSTTLLLSQEVFPRVFLSMFYNTTTQPRGFSKSFPLNVLQHYYSTKRFFQEFSSQCSTPPLLSQEVFPRVFLSMFYTTTTQPRGFSKIFPLNVLHHYYSAKRFFQEFSSQCSTPLLLSQEVFPRV